MDDEGKPSNPVGRAARAMHNFFFENLRNPARSRRAGLMRQFRSGQLDSTVDLDQYRFILLYRHTHDLFAYGIALCPLYVLFSCTY